jgi:hypothetical protein
MGTKLRALTIYVDPEWYRDVQSRAKQCGRPLSNFVARFLARYKPTEVQFEDGARPAAAVTDPVRQAPTATPQRPVQAAARAEAPFRLPWESDEPSDYDKSVAAQRAAYVAPASKPPVDAMKYFEIGLKKGQSREEAIAFAIRCGAAKDWEPPAANGHAEADQFDDAPTAAPDEIPGFEDGDDEAPTIG